MQGRLRDDIGELIKEKKKTNTEKDTKPKIQQKKKRWGETGCTCSPSVKGKFSSNSLRHSWKEK